MKLRKLTNNQQKQYRKSKKVVVLNESFDNGTGSATCNPSGVTWIGDISMGWAAGRQSNVSATCEYTDEKTFSGTGKSMKITITSITGTVRGAHANIAHNNPQSSWTVNGENNKIEVIPNTNYVANVKAYAIPNWSSGSGSVQLYAGLFKADGTQTGASVSVTSRTTNTWLDMTLMIPKISDAKYISFMLRLTGVTGDTGVAYFDDFNLFSDN